MNYSPYMMPYGYMPMGGAASTASRGLFRGLLGSGINFSSIMSGAGKFLNVANQAIPIIRQATPVLKNAKTMFKVMNEFKKTDTPTSNVNTNTNNTKNNDTNNVNSNIKNEAEDNNRKVNYSFDGGPTFFM